MRDALLVRRLPIALALVMVAVVGAYGPPGAGAAEAAIAGLQMPLESELEAARSLVIPDEPRAIDGDVDLEAILQRVVRSLDALPAAEWDMEALAVALEFDPEQAFAFVRDRIAFEPYRGVLRGPAGTFAARAGNSFDRALLLGSLLEAMAMPARFAVAELDEATAGALVQRALDLPTRPLAPPLTEARSGVDPDALGDRARRDYALLVEALGDRIDALEATDMEQALTDVRQHVWVQVALGSEWLDLDPTLPDAVAGATMVAAQGTIDRLPESEVQRVGIRVDAEILDQGALRSETLLDESFDAWFAASNETYLVFAPEIEEIGGTLAEAVGGAGNFVPRLIVDGEARDGTPFPVHPQMDIFSGAEVDGPRLARLRLVTTVSVPGRPSVDHVRTIVDRVPPELVGSPRLLGTGDLAPLEEDRAGPLSLQPLLHILISTGGRSPWQHAVRQARALLQVDSLLRDEEAAASWSPVELLRPFAVANEGIVLASERTIVPSLASGPGTVAFVAEPRVYTVSFRLTDTDPIGAVARTDLVHDPVRVLSAGPDGAADAARARLWYGALQTALETEHLLGVATTSGPGATVESVSTMMSRPLVTLGPDTDRGAELPRDMRAAFDEGLLVIVPGDADRATGWWTVAANGSTRSTGPGGRGWGEFISPDITKKGPGTGISRIDPATGNAVSNKLPGEPVGPRKCPRNEYFLIVICVSVPGMIVIAGMGLLIVIIALAAAGVIGGGSG